MRLFATLCLMSVLFAACSSPGTTDPTDGPTDPGGYLIGADQVLPGGVVGVRYEASALVEGGIAPYTWSLGEGERAPGGLVMQADGVLAGVPSEAGEHTFVVIAEDSFGRTKRMFLTISVRLDFEPVACGETVAGVFSGTGMSAGGPDFDRLESLAWVGIEVPEPEIQRVSIGLRLQNPAVLYVQRPAEPLGSWNLEEEYVAFNTSPPVGRNPIVLDPGTDPSLTGYRTQSIIPLLLVAQGAGTWEITVTCSDGPVFERLPQFPTELGTELDIDYDVFGNNEGVRFTTPDPLPEWMIWNEETGEVTGTAEEPGAWEFTIIAETADGRRREERSIIGVFEVLPASCDEVVQVDNEQTYFEGEFGGYWDPRGYAVHRLDLTKVSVSAIDLQLFGTDGQYVGIANPDPGWLKFYGGGMTSVAVSQASLFLDPRTYPSTHHYTNEGEAYVIAAATGTLGPLQLVVGCDTEPRPDLAALPVVEPFVEADFPLPAIGGTAPYSFEITGLPTGLSVRGDRLVGTTSSTGSFGVSVKVTDSLGASSDNNLYTLFVGLDEACYDATRVTCGDTIEGTFTSPYYADGNGASSTKALCFVDRSQQSLGFEITSVDDAELRVDVAHPGADVRDMFDGDSEYAAFVEPRSSEGVAINPFTWPRLDDMPYSAIRVGVRAFSPGEWSVQLVCQ